MLIQYGQALSNYLYDVFVAKFDFWLAFGLLAQLAFAARFRAPYSITSCGPCKRFRPVEKSTSSTTGRWASRCT